MAFGFTAREAWSFFQPPGAASLPKSEPTGAIAFTKALIEALKGAADTGDGEITIAELDSYLTDRVRGLTGGAQTPVQIRPPGVPGFTFFKVARP